MSRQKIAFRRDIQESRSFEINALFDSKDLVACFYEPVVLRGGKVSAQFLRAEDSSAEADLTILFRFSAPQGQAVDIVGPFGDEYRWIGWIAAQGLGNVYIDRGVASDGSHNFDLIAEIQGQEVRYVYDISLDEYRPQDAPATLGLLTKKAC